MRKHVKFLTMILAVILMLQVAPLAAFGDSIPADTYQDEGQETNNDTGTEPETPAEPEVDTEAPTEPEEEPEAPAEPAIALTNVQWRVNGSNQAFIALENGGVVLTNDILFRLDFSAKPTALTVKMNGLELETTKMLNFAFVSLTAIDGNHEMEVIMETPEGSKTEIVSFNVYGGEDYPSFELEAPTDLLWGESSDITLSGTNLQNLEKLDLTLAIDRNFDVEDVVLPDGVAGMYMWFRGELQIIAEVVDPSKLTGDALATIRVKAPATPVEDGFVWSVVSSEATLTEESGLAGDGTFVGGFQMSTPEVGVTYAYVVNTSGIPTKGLEYTLFVETYTGDAAANVPVYAVIDGENQLVGMTDESGKLTTTFFNELDSYTVVAMTDDGVCSEPVSFNCVTPVGDESGAPYGIMVGAPVYNGKSFSWMSHLIGSDEQAVLQLSTVAGMSNAVEIFGTSTVTYYDGDSKVNRINTVEVTDLAPGFTYYYRVGDGTVWSEVGSFTVKAAAESDSFVVLGDINGSANISNVIAAINGGNVAYDFAIQTGALLGSSDSYGAWAALTDGFKGFGLDTIHAFNTNELNDLRVQTMFGQNGAANYSYEIGNVYVAVINTAADEAELTAALEWLYEDAKISDCTWKILVTHTPAYSTDATVDNALLAELLPAAAERANINVVFSGATGSYSRTEPFRGGEVNEENGVIYITAGSFGTKGAEFAAGNEYAFATNFYDAVYVGVTATADTLTITAYNVAEDGTVVVLDTFTESEFVCADGEHDYRVNFTTGEVICDHCDDRIFLNDYVGPVHMHQDLYFMENGSLKSGWIEHNGKTYYFMPWGVNGVVEVDGYTYVFEDYVLKIGAWFERNGITMLKWAGVTQKNTWITMDGKTYYFRPDGSFVTGVVSVPVEYVEDEVTYEYHEFDENGVHQGRLTDGLHVYDDLIIYTVNGVPQHVGLVMDEEGNFYYISSSCQGVRDVTRYISHNWTNGLLPEGTYTFGADGKMIDPPAADE